MRATSYPPAMRQLVNELTKLPTIGEKTATRLAYFLLTRESNLAEQLAGALQAAKERTRFCEVCFALTEESVCSLCADSSRTRSLICVVERPPDVIAVERTGGYNGLYHVLHGVWSPLKGVGPEQTKIGDLVERLQLARESKDPMFPPVTEVILGTSTTVEGDATAMYIASNVSAMGIPVTRIAQGLPKGGELEYADEVTLSHALEGRRQL